MTFVTAPAGPHVARPSPPPRLVTAKAAARELGIPYNSLRDLAHRGLIAVVRVGRAWYFERRELDRLIDRLREQPSER
ncbi:MAG: helix-turn-helix domain-containing protein [Acidobacteria bacterium]|nr:helix-turn-helix domain-containing protein [Acidobacteriota bacterium]